MYKLEKQYLLYCIQEILKVCLMIKNFKYVIILVKTLIQSNDTYLTKLNEIKWLSRSFKKYFKNL